MTLLLSYWIVFFSAQSRLLSEEEDDSSSSFLLGRQCWPPKSCFCFWTDLFCRPAAEAFWLLAILCFSYLLISLFCFIFYFWFLFAGGPCARRERERPVCQSLSLFNLAYHKIQLITWIIFDVVSGQYLLLLALFFIFILIWHWTLYAGFFTLLYGCMYVCVRHMRFFLFLFLCLCAFAILIISRANITYTTGCTELGHYMIAHVPLTIECDKIYNRDTCLYSVYFSL